MPDLDPALALVASMVLDNGSRWGDAATPEQWDDMQALLTDERRAAPAASPSPEGQPC